jgi:integrase
MISDPDVASVIANYRPRSIPPDAADFARTVATRAGPASVSRAKAFLFAAGRLGAYAASLGDALVPEAVITLAMIERFVPGASMSAPSRRTMRSNLLCLAQALAPAPGPAPIPRERAKPGYSPAQIAAYLALADAQPSQERRRRAVGLVGLGAGAGLRGADLRLVRGLDIAARSGGLVVNVRGPRPRVVPILVDYHHRLEEVAAYFGGRFVIGGAEPNRRNITTGLISSLSGGEDLARLEIPRLRSTWLARVAQAMGLRAFMDAAGIVCSQRLGDVVGGLGPVSEEVAVQLLSGRSG